MAAKETAFGEESLNNASRPLHGQFLHTRAVSGYRLPCTYVPRRGNNPTRVLNFPIEKDKTSAFRWTTAEWLKPHNFGARLVGSTSVWHAVTAEMSPAVDTNTASHHRVENLAEQLA